MKIEITLTPNANYHRAGAKVIDWFGLRVRYFRCMYTGNLPGGEWVPMDTVNHKMPRESLAKKMTEATEIAIADMKRKRLAKTRPPSIRRDFKP